MNVTDILQTLVAIPTASAQSNLPLLHYVRDFLEPRGWSVQLFPYQDENAVEKANLIARPAGADLKAPIGLAFVCHTDTVPSAPDWTDALRLHARANNLHGCGACDVKGALACFLAAVASAPQPRPDGVLLLTADEEIGCKGMERLLAETDLHIASAIVSEPTSLRPGIAGKGYGLAKVTVQGIEAHSAFPAEGESAISVAAHLITALAQQPAVHQIPAESAELFDPARTTLNVGMIEGGSAKNIIAGHCAFLVEWRPLPEEDPHAVARQLSAQATELAAAYPRVTVHVETLRAEPGFAPAATGPLQKRLHALTGRLPHGISFGSEASRLARVAKEVIVIGPGDMHTAHSDRECVPTVELEEWTGILRGLFSRAPGVGG